MQPHKENLAVFDLGSNTTKLTVLELPQLRCLYHQAIATRIGQDLTPETGYKLTRDSIERLIEAILFLIDRAEAYHPEHYEIVGTSALRESQNKKEISDRIQGEIGLNLEVLSGIEEAELIGMGANTDPALGDLQGTFTIIDLGGGSLECIDYVSHQAQQVTSLPLGAVLLDRKFLTDHNDSIPFHEVDALFEDAKNVLQRADFQFEKDHQLLVGMGGTLVTVRSMIAASEGMECSRSSPVLNVHDIGGLLTKLTSCSLDQRQSIPGIDPERADILPAAITILLALADVCQVDTILHSYRNLPYGLASRWMEER